MAPPPLGRNNVGACLPVDEGAPFFVDTQSLNLETANRAGAFHRSPSVAPSPLIPVSLILTARRSPHESKTIICKVLYIKFYRS